MRQFIGEIREAAINDQLNDQEWRVFSADKIVFYTFLKGLDLPFPPVYGIYHLGGRFMAGVRAITDRQSLVEYLRTEIPYPFFSKPSHGGYGVGASLVECYDDSSDSLVLANGQRVGIEPYTRELEASLSYGHVFQQPLKPHPRAAELCNDKLPTLRLNMLTDEHGPHVFRAFWAIPVGSNMVSNFGNGSAGNLLCAVNSETGIIQRSVRGAWHERKEVENHPVSGHALTGFALPDWDKAVQLAKSAARALPRLLSTHWDVALTADGPVLLEVNFQNVFRGPQIAFGKGSLDSDLIGVLAGTKARHQHSP
jgi:hypothetical protein